MNDDDMIDFALESGLAPYMATFGFSEMLERFAALVAAHAREKERQRTIQILMELHRKTSGQHNYYHFAANEIRGFSI